MKLYFYDSHHKLFFSRKRLVFVKMFGLFTLIEASLLFLNAVAVLHEERFLKKFGFADDTHQGFGEPGMKV